MKKILVSLIFVSLASFHVHSAEPIAIILNPTQNNVSEAISLIRQRSEVKELVPVFSLEEKKALVAMGEGALSQSHKFKVYSERDLNNLNSFIKVNNFPIKLDKNSLAISMTKSLSYVQEQWGNKNDGSTLPLFTDRYGTINIPGKKGEDIGKSKEIPSKTGKKVVAVLDSGVDVNHPSLKNKIYRKEKECKAFTEYRSCLAKATTDLKKLSEEIKKNGGDLKKATEEMQKATKACHDQYANLDSDGNGYPLDCEGWNLLSKNEFPNDMWGTPFMDDDAGHGTHIAGIIAANENPQGMKGCTQNALILPVRVIENGPRAPVQPQSADENLPNPKEEELKLGKGFGDVIARGLLYAIRSKVDVINMSLGWPAQVDSEIIRKMIAIAQKNGIVVVAAAGNDSTDSLIMPCVYPGVICVGAHSNDGSLSHFSNYGSGVDIAAPGFRILSTFPMEMMGDLFTDMAGYEFKSGTSMATPFAACAAVDFLGQGMGKDEIHARLMLGARPHQMSTLRDQQMKNKFTLSGNLDIDRALAVSPQPFISLQKKEPINIAWDGKSNSLSLNLELKNYWQTASMVSVNLSLGEGSNGLRVGAGSASVSNWQSGTEKSFDAKLDIERADFSSEITLLISVSVDNGPARIIPAQAVVTVNVNAKFDALDAVTYPVKGIKFKPTNLRSVTNLEGENTGDYMIVERDPKDLQKSNISLLSVINGAYEITYTADIGDTGKDSSLMQIQKLDLNFDGKRDYVLIYRIPNPDVKKRTFSYLFVCLTNELKLLALPFKEPSARIHYLQETAALPPDFQWVKNGNFKMPAWVSVGLKVDDNKPDPWKLKPANIPTLRLYYMNFIDFADVSEVDGYTPVTHIKQDADLISKGIMPVLLGKQNGYMVQYAFGEFSDGKITNIRPLVLDQYRNLIGETSKLLLSMDSRHNGNSFVTPIGSGKTRITWITNSGEIIDKILDPVNKSDSVEWVSGAFWGDSTKALFAQTHYEMQFHDLNSNTVKTTSLNRYSFMPVGSFAKIFFPVSVLNEELAKSVPGLYIPNKLGLSASSMVMVPRYNRAGQLLAVERPARLRFLAEKGCVAVEDAIVSDAKKTTELMFNCGENFIRIPLKF